MHPLADEPWKKAVLEMVAVAIGRFGLQGIQVVETTLNDLMAGQEVNLDWVDLSVSSDILALLQNAEADQKTATNDFLKQVGEVLGRITSGFLRGLLATV